GHLLPDHVHMCIAIPAKYPVASVIGFLRRNSSLGCRRYWGHFVPQLGGFRLEVLNLEFAVFKLVEGRSLVHVFHPVAQHAVDQAGQLGRHGFDGNRGTEPGSESTELRPEIGVACPFIGKRRLPINNRINVALKMAASSLTLKRLSGESAWVGTKARF